MIKFNDHLNSKLQNNAFAKIYNEEKELLMIGVQIAQARELQGLTQAELAQKCRVTQQQLSRVERGGNCNMLTLIKISSVLGYKVGLSA